MASDQEFVNYVLDQIESDGEIVAKKMFGEYGIYCAGKLFALVCDNRFLIKPTKAGREFIGEVVEESPYPGAKPSFLIKEKLEDREWLAELISLTVAELPKPKPKKKRK